MNSKTRTRIIALALFAALAIPVQLAAQGHARYKLIDIGTFGGPASDLNNGNDGSFSVNLVNNQGALAGWADTAAPDPFPSFCFYDCYVTHAFRWQDGVMTDLGTLADGVSSQAGWISASGLIAGVSENGEIDPLISGFPENRAVLWQKGGITDLGTLPEGGYESFANAVNSGGQVVGWAENTTPDPNSLAGPGFFPTQTRAFLWESGAMKDLGTLGGSGALAQFVNEQGQVVGWSYTSSAPNTSCPNLFPLATGSFIWEKDKGMTDLGSLGGTCTLATGLNNKGTVVGIYVNDNQIERGFVWKRGSIHDLGGSLGGDYAGAEGINDHGVTAGWAYLAGNTIFHAALWRRVGKITDLGVLGEGQCSFASSINAKTQIVGASITDDCNFDNNSRAFFWEGGAIFDLNTLIPAGSALHLQWARSINDRGEIAGTGLDADGNVHAFLLIPCDKNHSGIDGCDYSLVDASATTRGTAAPAMHQSATTIPRTPTLCGTFNGVRRVPRHRPGPMSYIHGPITHAVDNPQTPGLHDSDSHLEDKIAIDDRAEVVDSFGSTSSTTATINSCPAVRCSLHHTYGSVCGVRLCHIPGTVQPIWKGYDLTYKRVCFYGC